MLNRCLPLVYLVFVPTLALALGEVTVQGKFPFTWADHPYGETRTYTARCPVLEDTTGTRLQGGLLAARTKWDTEMDRHLFKGIQIKNEQIIGQIYTVTVINSSFPFATPIDVTLVLTCEYTSIQQ